MFGRQGYDYHNISITWKEIFVAEIFFCLVTLNCLKWHPRFKLQSHGFVRAVVGVNWEFPCCEPCWLSTVRGGLEDSNRGPTQHAQEEELCPESKTPLLSIELGGRAVCRQTKELFPWLKPTEHYFPLEVWLFLWNSRTPGLLFLKEVGRGKSMWVHIWSAEWRARVFPPSTPPSSRFICSYLHLFPSSSREGLFLCSETSPPMSSIIGSPSTPQFVFLFYFPSCLCCCYQLKVWRFICALISPIFIR